jgi:hypothetical protein
VSCATPRAELLSQNVTEAGQKITNPAVTGEVGVFNRVTVAVRIMGV